MKGVINMSVTMQSTVYVEGYCEYCERKIMFYTRVLEMEMKKNNLCIHCRKGEICITKYEIGR
jgi:hypothetical protein